MGVSWNASLPIAQYPEITPPEVVVEGTYTGASSVDVELSVATPIEQKVNGVENMIYMKSTNASSGSMSLQVSFEVGTDLDMANVLTQNRVSEAQALLLEMARTSEGALREEAIEMIGIGGDPETLAGLREIYAAGDNDEFIRPILLPNASNSRKGMVSSLFRAIWAKPYPNARVCGRKNPIMPVQSPPRAGLT